MKNQSTKSKTLLTRTLVSVFAVVSVLAATSQTFAQSYGLVRSSAVPMTNAGAQPTYEFAPTLSRENIPAKATHSHHGAARSVSQPIISTALPDWYAAHRTNLAVTRPTGVLTRTIVRTPPPIVLRDFSPPPPPRLGFIFVFHNKHK